MDGVLADWSAGMERTLVAQRVEVNFLDWSRWEGVREDAAPEHREAFAAAMASAFFYRDLYPIWGAIEALHEMRDAGHEVFICSTPDSTNRSCASDKIAWVRHHLGDDWVKRLILTHDKTLVHGDVLVDDKPEVTGSNPVPSWEHVLFGAPYNRHITDRRRIADWTEWAEVLG